MSRPVTRIGITRRLQALQAMGWTQSQIARAAGLCRASIQRLTNDEESRVNATTALAVVEVYQQLSWRTPPQRRPDQVRMVTLIRRGARQRGFIPPAAWDHIDDPDELPRGAKALRETSRPAPLDDALNLLRAGVRPEDVAARCGVSATSLARRLRRNGHHLWAAACERRPGR